MNKVPINHLKPSERRIVEHLNGGGTVRGDNCGSWAYLLEGETVLSSVRRSLLLDLVEQGILSSKVTKGKDYYTLANLKANS